MRAVIYCRISDDRTGLAAGVQRQEADARSLCARNGWEVVEVQVDNDISASRYSKKVRPGYRRVLELASTGAVGVIATYDVDRLYRRPSELEELIDLAETVRVASVQGDLRLDTSDGRAVARVLAAMAAKSSDDTSRRVKRKHLELAEAGVPVGGRRPYGYEDDKVTIRPTEAARIREAAARVLGGESLTRIIREWNETGVPSSTGKTWRPTILGRILSNPRITGLRALSGEVIGEGKWDPILDRPTFDALQQVLQARSFTMPDLHGARSYLLAGLVWCGEPDCGARMTTAPQSNRGHRYRRYACRKDRGGCNKVGISADRLEPDVVAYALAYLTREIGPVDPAGPLDLEDEIARSIREAEVRLVEHAADAAVGRLSPDAFRAFSDAHDRVMADLRRRMAQSAASTLLDTIRGADDPASAFEAMPWDRQRLLVVETVESVTIAPAASQGIGYDFGRAAIKMRG